MTSATEAAGRGSSAHPPINSVTLGNSGPTVLMLHGWGKAIYSLRPMAEILATSCRVILVDLPGFGRSPLPLEASNEGGGWNTAQYAARIKELLDEMGVSSCVVLGHSFGGRVGVRLAAAHPELVKSLVLIGTPGVPRVRLLTERIRSRLIKFSANTSKRIDGLIGTRLFAHYFAPRFGSVDYRNAGELRKTFVKTVNEDLSPEAKLIKAPTLLLWGANDKEAPVDQAEKYSQLLSDSELHVFPNKGHEPFSDVGSHLLALYIEAFLTKRGLLT